MNQSTMPATDSHRTSLFRRIFLLIRLAGIIAVVVLAAIAAVPLTTQQFRFERAVDVPPTRVAIVFGAGIRPDGEVSPMLADRVEAAVELYQLGRVQKLLMTGDNSRVNYDEVNAMRRYAIAHGVAENDITLDYAGFSTYESCYRARPIFGVEEAVLVTQRYHLPRAVYTCRALGMRATGLATPDWERVPWPAMVSYVTRETLATGKALWELHITRPLPTFLGPYEGIL